MEKEFVALYTGQKQKKAKTWHDGTVKHSGHGNKAVLYDEKGSKLDSIYIKIQDLTVGEQIESDRYLILIEDLKHETKTKGNPEPKPQAATVPQRPQFQARCAGLKRKKTGFVPPRMINLQYSDATENSQQDGNNFLDTRRYGGTDQQTGGLGQSKNVLAIHEAKDRVNDSSFSAIDARTKLNEQVSLGTDEKSRGVIANALAGNNRVGVNMLNIYNKFGGNVSSQLDSSQGSDSEVGSVKALSPWSVYGSNTSSPSLGSPQSFSRKTTAAQEPNEMKSGTAPAKPGVESFTGTYTNENTAQTSYREDSERQHFEIGKPLKASEKVIYKNRLSESIAGPVATQKRSMDQIMSLLRKKPQKTDDVINTSESKDTDSFVKHTENHEDDDESTCKKNNVCDIERTDGNMKSNDITDSCGKYVDNSEDLFQSAMQGRCDVNDEPQTRSTIQIDTKLSGDSQCPPSEVTLNNEVEKIDQSGSSGAVTLSNLLGEHWQEEETQEEDDASKNDDSFGYFDLTFSPMSNASESDTELPGKHHKKAVIESLENHKQVENPVQPLVAEDHKEARTCVGRSVSPGFIQKTVPEKESENNQTLEVDCVDYNSSAVKSQVLNNSSKETDSENAVTDKSKDKYKEVNNAANRLEAGEINHKGTLNETSPGNFKDTNNEVPLKNDQEMSKADDSENFDVYMDGFINDKKAEKEPCGKNSFNFEENAITKQGDEISEKDTYTEIPTLQANSKKDDDSQMTYLTQDTMEFSCETLADDSQTIERAAEENTDINDIWSQAKSYSVIDRKHYGVTDNNIHVHGKHVDTVVKRRTFDGHKLRDNIHHSDFIDEHRETESPPIFPQSSGFPGRQRFEMDNLVQQKQGQRINDTPSEDGSLERESFDNYASYGKKLVKPSVLK